MVSVSSKWCVFDFLLWAIVFFFSSRRRHTRFSRDWSSDVCSSDLYALFYEATDLGPVLRKLSANAYTRRVDRDFRNTVVTRAMPVTVTVANQSLDEQRTRGLAGQAELELLAGQTSLLGVEFMLDELDSDKLGTTTRVTPMGTVV